MDLEFTRREDGEEIDRERDAEFVKSELEKKGVEIEESEMERFRELTPEDRLAYADALKRQARDEIREKAREENKIVAENGTLVGKRHMWLAKLAKAYIKELSVPCVYDFGTRKLFLPEKHSWSYQSSDTASVDYSFRRWALEKTEQPFTSDLVERVFDMMVSFAQPQTFSRDLIRLTPSLYFTSRDGYNGEKGGLIDYTEDTNTPRYSFVSLADDPAFPLAYALDSDLLQFEYANNLEALEKSGGRVSLAPNSPFPVFDFIKDWAVGNEDIYNDMLIALASPFMADKPKGAFFLTGTTRNGKSTFVALAKRMFSAPNVSNLQITEFADYHRNNFLATSVINAPDEEYTKIEKDQLALSMFKSASSHEPITVPVMYSAKPLPIDTGFVMYCPMNAEPSWDGPSASALTKRTLAIPFYADFSQRDTESENFVETTFTVEMYQNLIPLLIAIARYYSMHPIHFSQAMTEYNDELTRDDDNRSEYARQFVQHFTGYESAKDVYDDYRNWCSENGYRYAKQADLMHAIKTRGRGITRRRVVLSGGDHNVCRFGASPATASRDFILQAELTELHTVIGDYVYQYGVDWRKDQKFARDHISGHSIVTALNNALKDRDFTRREEKRAMRSDQWFDAQVNDE